MNKMLDGNTAALERHQAQQDEADRKAKMQEQYIEMRARERLCVVVGKDDLEGHEHLTSEAFTPGDRIVIGSIMSCYYAAPDQVRKDIFAAKLGREIIQAIEAYGLQTQLDLAEKEILE